MIGFLNYNFCGDINCFDPFPTNANQLTISKISNGIFDRINITADTVFTQITQIPTTWDFNTILNASFNGNVDGGNIETMIENMSAIKIKRRVKGSFTWDTIKEVPITSSSDLTFIFNDVTNICNTEYEYALVPIMGNVEGNYIIESVYSKFNGIYICDVNNLFKFFADVDYGSTESVQKVGVYEPFGRQYPIIVSNSLLNYETGRFSALVLPDDFKESRSLNRKDIVEKRNQIVSYMKNKQPKILKDWNGNAWIVVFTGNPQTDYAKEYGLGMERVTCDWTQVGDASNVNDLKNTGLISVGV